MSGKISKELEVKVPAAEAWNKVYGTLKVEDIIRKSLRDNVSKVDVVRGNGEVGTILHFVLTPKPGIEGILSYSEELTVVDNEKRVKVAQMVEGGYLDMGFKSYKTTFEVIEKSENECITRSTIEYEVKDKDSNAASLVSITPLVTLMQAIANYLILNHTSTTPTTTAIAAIDG